MIIENFTESALDSIRRTGVSDPVRLLSEEFFEGPNFALISAFINAKKSNETWYSQVIPSVDFGVSVETIQNSHLSNPEVQKTINDSSAMSLAALILGEPVRLWRSTFWIKEPGARRVEWHQDTFKEEKLGSFPNVNFWIALDDATEDTCMRFVERTHKSIINLNTFSEAGYKLKLECDAALPAPPVGGVVKIVPLKRGECVIFDGRILHGSPPNLTCKRRAGLVLRFIPKYYAFNSTP